MFGRPWLHSAGILFPAADVRESIYLL